MLKIGLTGNIGSGKTMVAGIFSTLGIPIYHADEEAKKFLDDPDVITAIVRQFGYGILTTSNEINRRSLASVVFTDPLALQVLNDILHPRVRIDFRSWANLHLDKPYVVQEAAIILESGFAGEYDLIIDTSCPEEIAIGRVMKRDGIDRNSVLRRMQFQLGDEEKSARCDFVIRNSGAEMVIPQVLAIHRELLEIYTQRNNDLAARPADA